VAWAGKKERGGKSISRGCFRSSSSCAWAAQGKKTRRKRRKRGDSKFRERRFMPALLL
jgi:hypothetical protein